MDRKILFVFVLLMGLAMLATPFLTLVQAEPRVIVTRGSYLGRWYTTTHVVLGDANNTIRIPDNWNGRLIVLCRGFVPTLDPNQIPMDSQSKNLTWYGYATAMSNFGTGGYCVQEGMIRTHQLTEYVIDNYGVTDEVYLIGWSMGGNIALLLGAKYPNLYDGVLDVYGTKNLISQYDDKMYLASIQDNVAFRDAVLLKYGVTIPLAAVDTFRAFLLMAATAIEQTCGGTPEEKPKTYERFSPTFSAADIAVPTITVHGTLDIIVPYYESIDFMNAVAAAGHLNMYRLYKVVGVGHAPETKVTNQALGVNIWRLVDGVENGNARPPSTP